MGLPEWSLGAFPFQNWVSVPAATATDPTRTQTRICASLPTTKHSSPLPSASSVQPAICSAPLPSCPDPICNLPASAGLLPPLLPRPCASCFSGPDQHLVAGCGGPTSSNARACNRAITNQNASLVSSGTTTSSFSLFTLAFVSN